MKQLIWICVMFFSLAAFGATELVVGVKNMVCTSCVEKIEKKFKAFKEVESAHVNLEEESLTLRFKKGQRLPDEKIRAVLKDAGYEAVIGS